MKYPPLVFWLALISSAARLNALTFPVFEDTSARNDSITKATGAAGNLTVAPNRPAFVRFDLSASSLSSADVGRARLIFYIQKVTKPGSVKLRAVTSDWTESVLTPTPQPTVNSDSLATVVIGAGMSKQFVTVDVTDQVKEWLAAPETDFGFSVASDGPASILLGAKEGPGSGYPAALEIEKDSKIDNSHVASGIDVVKLGNGNIDNNEFAYLDGLTGAIQLQINQLNSDVAGVTQSTSSVLAQKLNKAGDTMTGTLNLPVNGLKVGSDQLALVDGVVGLGTTAPTARLDVRGDIKLGSTGQFYAASGQENLRIVRGRVRYSGGALSISDGNGFTISGPVQNGFSVTFDPPFSGVPMIFTTRESENGVYGYGVKSVSSNGCYISEGAVYNNTSTHIIAIGPR